MPTTYTKSMLDRARRHLSTERDRVNGVHTVHVPRTADQAEDAESLIEALCTQYVVMQGPDPVTFLATEAEARVWAEHQVLHTNPGARLAWTDTGKLMLRILSRQRFTAWRVVAVRTPEHLVDMTYG